MPAPETVTQAYAGPLVKDGERFEAGIPVELPVPRAKVMAARLGLANASLSIPPMASADKAVPGKPAAPATADMQKQK